MRQIRVLFIVAGVLFGISGCKTHTPAPQSAAQPSSVPVSTDMTAQSENPGPFPLADTAAQTDHRPVLVCFGDSLTAGHGTDPGQSYPDYLQADLEARGYSYRVVNAGISGNTTKDGVERLDNVVALKPYAVVVEFGGNDGLRGVPIESSRANLDKIISTLKATGAKVALAGITLPPNYGSDYINQFNATYTLLAKKYHVPLLPFILKGAYGVNGMMQSDQVHATAAGNKIVAENVLSLVLPLLKKQ